MAQATDPQEFANWCREQGDREYVYLDNYGCAFWQFLKSTGVAQRPWVGWFSWRDEADESIRGNIPDAIDRAAQEHPRTFVALADRLAA